MSSVEWHSKKINGENTRSLFKPPINRGQFLTNKAKSGTNGNISLDRPSSQDGVRSSYTEMVICKLRPLIHHRCLYRGIPSLV